MVENGGKMLRLREENKVLSSVMILGLGLKFEFMEI